MQLSPSGMRCGAKTNFITVLFFHTAPLHFMENKAHFVPLIRPCKVQYIYIYIHEFKINPLYGINNDYSYMP